MTVNKKDRVRVREGVSEREEERVMEREKESKGGRG